MAWSDEDEARAAFKLLKCGALEPEDLTRNEFRVLRQYYPRTWHFVKSFLEKRQEMIENGEWSMAHEPVDREKRMNRYEQGNGLVKPWKGRTDGETESRGVEADD